LWIEAMVAVMAFSMSLAGNPFFLPHGPFFFIMSSLVLFLVIFFLYLMLDFCSAIYFAWLPMRA